MNKYQEAKLLEILEDVKEIGRQKAELIADNERAIIRLVSKDAQIDKLKAHARISKQERSNMRSHLQKWIHIYFDLENGTIELDSATYLMKELFFQNPYEKVEEYTGLDRRIR